MDLSVLVALFEENFEQHGHLPVDQLPDDVVELLDAPFALVCMTIVCASSPYDPDQEEFNRLLCWLDLASLQFAITAKHEPEMAEDVIASTSRVLHQAAQNGVSSQVIFFIANLLRRNRIPLSEEVMHDVSQSFEEDNEFGSLEMSPDDLVVEMEQFGIDSAESFAQFFIDQLAMLPEGACYPLFNALMIKPWAIDAAVLLLSHYDDVVQGEVRQFLSSLTKSQWRGLNYRRHLVILRHFADKKLRADIDRWLGMTLGNEPAAETLGKVEEAIASLVDGTDSMTLSLLVHKGDKLILWTGLFKLDAGLAEGYCQTGITVEDWQDVCEKSRENAFTYMVSPALAANILPWMLERNQATKTPLDTDSLMLLGMLEDTLSQPQVLNAEEMLMLLLDGTPNREALQEARLRSEFLLHYPMVESWADFLVPDDCTSSEDVMMAMFDANRERLAERFMLCGLVCSYAIGESKEIAQDAPLFLLNAHNILHNAINPNRRYPLLNRLADIAIQDAQYEQFREKVLETNRDPGDTYILKIELKECKPAVWRRLEISSKASLLEFHAVLQCAMGWEGYHSFEFRANNEVFPPLDNENADPNTELALVSLDQLLKKAGDEMVYCYDFGDDWQHRISLEKIRGKICVMPKVTTGKRAGPPEDCGGVAGYKMLLKAHKRRSDEDVEELDWAGWHEDYDPAHFDKDAANAAIRELYE